MVAGPHGDGGRTPRAGGINGHARDGVSPHVLNRRQLPPRLLLCGFGSGRRLLRRVGGSGGRAQHSQQPKLQLS